MIKLTYFLCLGHKIITKGFPLSIARTKDLHCYLKVPFTILTCTVDVGDSPFADTLQQKIVTEDNTFKIRHIAPRLSSLITPTPPRKLITIPFTWAIHRTTRDVGAFSETIMEKYFAIALVGTPKEPFYLIYCRYSNCTRKYCFRFCELKSAL